MNPETAAQLTLALFAATALFVVLWQAVRCPFRWLAWVLYAMARIYCPMLYHWRANRRCPFPETGPGLIIANHRSPVDPLIIWTNHHLGARTHHFRIMSFMMAREYYEVAWLKWMYHTLRAIPVERDGRDILPLRTALRRLQAGELVVVFPEGRINLEREDELLPGNPGIAWLAMRARVPVYPVFIHGSPGGSSIVEPFYHRARVRIVYGDPIDLSEYYDKKPTHTRLREVTDLLMTRLAELGGATYGPHESDEPEVAGRVGPISG